MADMKLFLGIVNEKKILGVINIGIGNKNQVSVTSVKVIWCKASVHAWVDFKQDMLTATVTNFNATTIKCFLELFDIKTSILASYIFLFALRWA